MWTDQLPAAEPGRLSTSDTVGPARPPGRPAAPPESAEPATPSDPGSRRGSGPLHWPGRRDVAVAAGVGVLDLLLFSDLVTRIGSGWSAAVAVLPLYAALGAAVLAYRRRSPGAVLALLCVHSAIAGLLLSYRPILGVCVALATVAARAGARGTVLAHLLATATSVTWVVNEVRTRPDPMESTTLLLVGVAYALLLVVPTGIGRWEHAGRRRVGELERRRGEAARLAVLAERRRVARELHDIVAHAVTVMVVQAAGARRVLSGRQPAVDTALTAVEDVGTQAVGELRRLLGVLRTTEGEDDAAETGGPTLAELAALVARMRGTNLLVSTEVRGAPGRLDPSVDRTAYRVVQEALTNVAKHAGAGAAATVTLTWQPRTLVIEISDDGRGTSDAGDQLSSGHGLLGLAERVALVEGTLNARPTGDGFRVTVTLPTSQPLSTTEVTRAARAC